MKPASDFSGLRALFLNCTLKKSPQLSHTEGLLALAQTLMQAQGVKTESLRPVDLIIPHGVQTDMREGGYEEDDWPELFEKVMAANILVLCTPIWLGEKSSVCAKIIERLYAHSSQQNEKGQYIFYGKVGACLVTGNEDGAKHCSRDILYALQHIGYSIPPQADAYWLGEAGPGPSYRDDESGGPENDFTNRSTTFLSWNTLYLAQMLKEAGGYPAYGNSVKEWEQGERFGFPSLNL